MTAPLLGSRTLKGGSGLFAIGDSITCGSCTFGPVGYSLGSNSHFTWATILSDGKLIPRGLDAVPGSISTTIRESFLPVAIANGAPMCVVMAGTNDVKFSGAIPPSVTKANLEAICSKLETARILPILCTIPPLANTGGFHTLIGRTNEAIERLCSKNGWIMVDMWKLLADTTTGDYVPAYSADGTHPLAVASKLMGQLIVDAVTPLIPASFARLARYNDDGSVILANPCLEDDTNADGIPDNWAFGGGTPATLALAPDAGVIGNAWSITRAAGDANYQTAAFTVAPGDLVHFAMRMKTDLEASGGKVQLSLKSSPSGSTLYQLFQMGTDFGWNTLCTEVVIPEGDTGLTVYLSVQAAGGAKLMVGQPTLYDLTTFGLE